MYIPSFNYHNPNILLYSYNHLIQVYHLYAPVTFTTMTRTVIYDARIVINHYIILVIHWRATLQAFAQSWWSAALVFKAASAIKSSRNYETVFKFSCDWKLSYSTTVDSWWTIVPSHCHLVMVLHNRDEFWWIVVPSFHWVLQPIHRNES